MAENSWLIWQGAVFHAAHSLRLDSSPMQGMLFYRGKGDYLMYRRKLKELNLMDDFLFNKMLTYPGIGEEFSRIFVGTIFGYTPKELLIIPQKVYFGADTQDKGVKLEFMKSFERDNFFREEGRKEGRAEKEEENLALKQENEYLKKKLSEYTTKYDIKG